MTTPTDRLTLDREWERVIAEITLLATPLDFDDLIARGILKKASAHWCWLLVPWSNLPDGFSRRIAAIASSPKGMKVRFWSATKAAKLARRLGIELATVRLHREWSCCRLEKAIDRGNPA